MIRRLLPLCLVVPGLVMSVAGPVAAHDSAAKYERQPLLAPPAEEAESSEAMRFVENLQYEPLAEDRAQSGSDIEFLTVGDKDYALAGTLRNGLQVVDITDPESPAMAAVFQCPINQGDVQVFKQGERVLASYTADSRINTDDGFAESQCVTEANELGADIDGTEFGTFLVDLTDPTAPSTVSFFEVPEGSHNQTIHPSGDYFYNSNSDLLTSGATPQVTIHDVSDPAEPREVQDYQLPFTPRPDSLGSESHDIFFNGTGTRAYVAALSQTLILDTSNPEDPSVVTQIVDPRIEVVHQSDLVSLPREDGSVRDLLIITDEQAGALPQSQCPGGGLHIYDVTGELETSPEKLGAWFIPAAGPVPGETCTSHVLRMHPEQGLMTIAWYSQGVRVLDISALAEFEGSELTVGIGDGAGMTEVGNFVFPDSDTWSFKTNRIDTDGSFYGYGNDIGRGFDVYEFTGDLLEDREVPALEPADLGAEGCSGVPVASAYGDRGEARAVHQRSIDCVIARSISQGSVVDGARVYRPLEDVTRAQMATFIVNTLRASGIDGELPRAPEEDAFSDVADSTHRDSINVLAEAGIVKGVGGGRYAPNAPVSRQQMASFMVAAADFALEPDLEGGSNPFTDVEAGGVHSESIATGFGNDLFRGTSATTFSPTVFVKRDQMASFLTNLHVRLGDAQVGPPFAGALEG